MSGGGTELQRKTRDQNFAIRRLHGMIAQAKLLLRDDEDRQIVIDICESEIEDIKSDQRRGR